MQELQYEPSAAGRPVAVEHDGGLTRIIVAMPGLYAPVPWWVYQMDVLALVVAPVWWTASLVIRVCLRLPKPPRAIFEISDEQLTMTMRDVATGQTTTFAWPRRAVVEARANRYESGLWMHVAGHVKESYLTDLPRETIQRLEAALHEGLASA